MAIVAYIVVYSTLTGYAFGLTACPDTWVPFQGSCYMFGHDNLTYAEAVVNCKSHESEIVRIETNEENLFLKDHISYMAGTVGYWIGLTDELVEGVYEWQDTDTVAEFTDWGPGEPNDASHHEDCVMLYSSKDWQWNDFPCSSNIRHICELLGENLGGNIVGK